MAVSSSNFSGLGGLISGRTTGSFYTGPLFSSFGRVTVQQSGGPRQPPPAINPPTEVTEAVTAGEVFSSKMGAGRRGTSSGGKKSGSSAKRTHLHLDCVSKQPQRKRRKKDEKKSKKKSKRF